MMKRVTHAAIAAVIALITHGCTTMQWTKPGADATAVARDQDDCRASALRRANPTIAGPGSPDARTDGGRPGVMSPTQGSNERFVAEHEEVRRCMLKRGYELRPAS